MPEVFTTENKEYYTHKATKGQDGAGARFTNEEVIQLRQRYIKETAKQIYKDVSDKISYQGLQEILWGRRYTDLPIYKKKEKKWINI